MIYLIDPKTKEPSVSLTMLAVSFVITVIAAVLQIFNVVNTTGVLMELLLTCTALYFTRRVTFKGQTFSSDKAEEIQSKLEKQ